MSLFNKDQDAKNLTKGEFIDNDFRARENDDENIGAGMELPPINKRSKSNRIVTVLGFLLMFAIGAALLFVVNKETPQERQDRLAKKAAQKPEKIANNLPALQMPPPSTPPQPPAAANPNQGVEVPAIDDKGLQGGVARPIPINNGPQPATTSKHATNGKVEMTWYERKMQGGAAPKSTGSDSAATTLTAQHMPENGTGLEQEQNTSELALRLTPTITKGVSAGMLPDRNMLITQGTKLACTLETAINTTLPGTTLCTIARDVYSTNGKVVLLDRGTRLVGQQQGNIKRGEARVFVLWTRAETPNGVIVNLNSAGTDTLGRAGLEGWVDNHFLERFGAAIMMTMLKGTVDVIVANQRSGTGFNFGGNGNGGDRVVERILQETINIPPTLIKNQGDDVEVIVQRDLDFSKVYELHASAEQ